MRLCFFMMLDFLVNALKEKAPALEILELFLKS